MMLLTASHYENLAAAHAAAKNPLEIFEAVAAIISESMGFGLLTMLSLEADGERVKRIFTTNENHYPVAGTEALGSTAWGDHVLRKGKPFFGADKTAVRWAFPADCELIESLGLGATMNIPITMLGRTLGSMNVLDRENSYNDGHFSTVCSLAPFLVSAFLA